MPETGTAPRRRLARAAPAGRALFAALLASLAALAALAAPGVQAAEILLAAQPDEPRAFGWRVGDVVTRRIALQVPAGRELDAQSLPRPGGRGRALELQRVELRRSLAGTPEELRLDYQVFLAPREPKVLELPAIELRFDGGERVETLRIDAWPVAVAPLAPVDAAHRDGLGEMRPDRAPPLPDTAWPRRRLVVELVAALALLGYLAHVYLVLPWSAQRRRPFGRAWAALRGLPAAPAAAQRRAAFERLHAALNETAGEVLFAAGLDRFVAAQPRFAPVRSDLVRFFERSRAEFFGGVGAGAAGATSAEPADPADTRWLVALGRRCRDLERGAA